MHTLTFSVNKGLVTFFLNGSSCIITKGFLHTTFLYRINCEALFKLGCPKSGGRKIDAYTAV